MGGRPIIIVILIKIIFLIIIRCSSDAVAGPSVGRPIPEGILQLQFNYNYKIILSGARQTPSVGL